MLSATGATLATLAGDDAYELGEGPVWDPQRQQLLWVDINRGTVYRGRLLDGQRIETVESFSLPQTVSAVAVAADGRLLLAGRERLFVRSVSRELWEGPRLLTADSGRRLNDGTPDPAGCLVIGSLRLNTESTTELLMRVDSNGHVQPIDQDLTLSNGLAWTASGDAMYSIDTLSSTVFRRSYDVATARFGAREVAFTVDNGFPDGMCLDSEENLWIAIWGAGEVRRYSPEGDLEQSITVPAPHVSSVAFAGPLLETLVVTTATQGLDPRQLAEHPLSGRLFTAQPGVSGLPRPQWNGVLPTTRKVNSPR